MGLTRRALLRDGSAAALAVFVARDAPAFGGVGVALPGPGERAFLTEPELATLRAAVDRFVPADVDAGAAAAGCAEAIDALLGAFAFDPPRIYAGGPFSDRAGSSTNHFASFVPLDPYEEKGWRLRIEGSQGKPELEYNGPVKGLQATYREGLEACEQQAGPTGFANLPGLLRDGILRSGDPAIQAFVDIAFPHTLELLYGAPEYGGNRDLIGWKIADVDGDVQPRGYTREQVEQPEPPGLLPDLSLAELLPLAPLAGSPELAHGIVTRSAGSLSALRREIEPAVRRTHGR